MSRGFVIVPVNKGVKIVKGIVDDSDDSGVVCKIKTTDCTDVSFSGDTITIRWRNNISDKRKLCSNCKANRCEGVNTEDDINNAILDEVRDMFDWKFAHRGTSNKDISTAQNKGDGWLKGVSYTMCNACKPYNDKEIADAEPVDSINSADLDDAITSLSDILSDEDAALEAFCDEENNCEDTASQVTKNLCYRCKMYSHDADECTCFYDCEHCPNIPKKKNIIR